MKKNTLSKKKSIKPKVKPLSIEPHPEEVVKFSSIKQTSHYSSKSVSRLPSTLRPFKNSEFLSKFTPITSPRLHSNPKPSQTYSKTYINAENILSQYKSKNDKELDKISLKEYKLFIGNYQVSKIIGTGARSKVFLALKNKEKYAMKVMKLTSNNLDDLANEKRILQRIVQLKSPFLVKTYEFLQTKSYVFFVTELLQGVSLDSYFEFFKYFSDDKVAFFSACILLAMETLHEANIFHRDISLRNINMDASGYVKLIDFGFSICPSDVLYGPRMSVINNKLVDLEDYGRCVCEMLTKEKVTQVPTKIKIEQNPRISKIARSFLVNLFEIKLTPLHGQGKCLTNLKKHDFFKKIDWPKLASKEMKSPYSMVIEPKGTSPVGTWHEITTTQKFTDSILDMDYSMVTTRKDKIEEKPIIEKFKKSIF